MNQMTVVLENVRSCLERQWQRKKKERLVQPCHCCSLAWLSHWHVALVTVGWSSLRMPSGPRPRYQHTPGSSCCPGPPRLLSGPQGLHAHLLNKLSLTSRLGSHLETWRAFHPELTNCFFFRSLPTLLPSPKKAAAKPDTEHSKRATSGWRRGHLGWASAGGLQLWAREGQAAPQPPASGPLSLTVGLSLKQLIA